MDFFSKYQIPNRLNRPSLDTVFFLFLYINFIMYKVLLWYDENKKFSWSLFFSFLFSCHPSTLCPLEHLALSVLRLQPSISLSLTIPVMWKYLYALLSPSVCVCVCPVLQYYFGWQLQLSAWHGGENLLPNKQCGIKETKKQKWWRQK